MNDVLYHAGVDGGLLDVRGDPGDECVSVLKVGVEVGLRWKDGNSTHTDKDHLYTETKSLSISSPLNFMLNTSQLVTISHH